ncbi:Ankyrin repeat domain-containing protein 34B [Liparis tanakae]|uniref:Ankyrin repeat domain-containing protein 34B n=1 Tax=Liparis tanakae TaxID=230148 RepID=A0A4Z2E6Z0_9TELE|nr:Ankyrin repeat domain-containing protein 34B [Liparis tanakae]
MEAAGAPPPPPAPPLPPLPPAAAMDSANPLLRAVFLGRLRLTRLLLEGGAYINESDGRGQTPLMVACRSRQADAQSASRVKLVRFLLEKGADPDIQDQDGRSALMHACREHAGPEVAALLLASGADIGLEDRSGTSALVHGVVAGDWKVLKLLLDTCKARGKEVIIIATDGFPCGNPQAQRYLSRPPPASPSEVQLVTSPSLCPPETAFSFREPGGASHPGSPSRAAPGGLQPLLLRLNSEPWLKVPPALLRQDLALRIHGAESASEPLRGGEGRSAGAGGAELRNRCAGRAGQKVSLPGLLSLHSASHPNLHSANLGTESLASSSSSSSFSSGAKHMGASLQGVASSSLHSVIQRRRLGDIYSSDPQLARDVRPLLEEAPRARDPADAKRLAPLRCSSTLGSREPAPPPGPGRRMACGYERRGSGAFLLDHGAAPRPRLPPLGLGAGEAGPPRGFLPSAPPGLPKEMSRRMLLRRHSMQTESFKTTA